MKANKDSGMSFTVTVLGISSATPTKNKHTTAQIITYHNNLFLVDCGEGTQFQLRRNKISIQKINHIFISHLHGDHYLGLPGLVSTMHLFGRQNDLHIYCPKMLKDIIDVNLKASGSKLQFKIIYHFTKDDQLNLLFENDKITISSFPLRHRIYCTGFVFHEKTKPRKINKEAIEENDVPIHFMNRLKAGEDFKNKEGTVIKNEQLTFDPKSRLSYAFCSDTAYLESLIPIVKNVDLLYHEATFTEEHKERAVYTYHSTAKDAATIAQKAEVNHLLIGHFSARYKSPNELLQEARSVFKNTDAAEENQAYFIE